MNPVICLLRTGPGCCLGVVVEIPAPPAGVVIVVEVTFLQHMLFGVTGLKNQFVPLNPRERWLAVAHVS